MLKIQHAQNKLAGPFSLVTGELLHSKVFLMNPAPIRGPSDMPALMRCSLVQSYPRTGSFLILGPEMPGEGCSRDTEQAGGASLVTAGLIVNKFHVAGDGRGER